MNARKTVYLLLIIIVALAGYSVGRLPNGSTQSALAAAGGQISDGLDNTPDSADFESYIPEIYRSPASATVTSQTTDIYFIPSDTNATNTVINIGNYNSTPVNISMKSIYDGSVSGTTVSFAIPGNIVARVSADSIVSGAPLSWSNTIFYNLTDIVDMVVVTIPSSGVIVDGYIAWSGTSTYNPDALNPVLPLRFSTDPYSLYLPSVAK